MPIYHKLLMATVFFTSMASFISSVILESKNFIPESVGQEWSHINGTVRASFSLDSLDSTTVDRVHVVASFYPIFEFAKKVGGDRIEVSSLIPFGIHPHEYEPTVKDVQEAENADLLVFNGAGLEGQWIKDIKANFILDTSKGLNLSVSGEAETDPHFWLDPLLAKQQVEKIRDGLIKIDPSNAVYYNENAKRLVAELENLDTRIRSDLSNCEKKDFITFHKAFSYFADRYGLTEHSIHEAEGEISALRIQQIINLAEDTGLDTIYSEELIDPRLANVIAQEIPAGKVLVLSPIEGINEEKQKLGVDYLVKMKENIENLRVGLKCK